MTDTIPKPLEALRHALYSSPSPEGFSDIVRLLASLSGQERDVALDFAQAHLAEWPDHARVYTLASDDPPVQADAWRRLLQRAPWVAPMMLGARVPRRIPHRDPDGAPVPVYDVACDPIGRYAWTLDARAPGGFGLWSLDTGMRPSPIRRHDAVDGHDWRQPHHAVLAVHHDPPRLARVTTSPEQETRISGGDLHTDYRLQPQGVWARSRLDGFAVQLPAHPAHMPYAAAFSADGAWFALASRSTSQVRVVHVGDSDAIYFVDLPHPEAVAFDLERDAVFALGAHGVVGAWSLTTRRLEQLDLPRLDAHPIAMCLAGDLLVTVLADLPRIDARTRDVTLTVRAHQLRPDAIAAESTTLHTLRGRFVDLVASRSGELRLATLSPPLRDGGAAQLTLTTLAPDAAPDTHTFGLPEPLPGGRGALRLSPFGDLLISAHPEHFTLWRTGAMWPPHVLAVF